MMLRGERQLDELGVFVHGVLAGLHVLGIVYNWRRRNWRDVVAHSAATAYDVWALTNHLRSLERIDAVHE